MTIRPFTPAQESAEDLDRRTVGRDQLLAILDERLRLAATTRTRQHTLLVGPRGSGKTHLIEVALYRALSQPDVADRLVVARAAEDVVGITSYPDLLRELAQSLGLSVGDERDPGALEHTLIGAAGDRTLVLVIENLDRVFRSIDVAGQSELRAWVETSGRVFILAATPTLFPAIRDRGKPWFGGFMETPVGKLTADQGRELLIHLASERGDNDLVDSLHSDRGKARIQAVSLLTAGSPRLWMVLSDCLDVESLDELIPAVEGLVEGLVPYYQSLLWDLSDTQQAIVRQLAEGSSAAMTAAEIAVKIGRSQQTVSKALGLLRESRWVNDEKLPEGHDQRTTWYALSEPMLRHHFQWRATKGEPLRLIVDLLRQWFDPVDLRRGLALAAPSSPRETYLAESLRAAPSVYDLAINDGRPGTLLALAREWMRGTDIVYSAQCGLLAELCVTALQNPDTDLDELVHSRCQQYSYLHTPSADLLGTIATEAKHGTELPVLLEKAADYSTGNTAAALYLLVAGLSGYQAPEHSIELLTDVEANPKSPLGLAITLERAFWTDKAGDTATAYQAVHDLLPVLTSTLGPDDSITLTARSNLAYYTGNLGNPTEALRLCQELLPDRTRTLGPDHPNTLNTRDQVAYYTGLLGNYAEALRLYQKLLTDRTRILGPDHPATLTTRYQVAYCTGKLGNYAEALRLYQKLLTDRTRTLGPDHPNTLNTRDQLAYYNRVVNDRSGIIEHLTRARAGDEEARIRLPAELRPLADSATPTTPSSAEGHPAA